MMNFMVRDQETGIERPMTPEEMFDLAQDFVAKAECLMAAYFRAVWADRVEYDENTVLH